MDSQNQDNVYSDVTVVGATADEDLVELEFSPLTAEEVVAVGDREYLLGVHADRHRVL